MYVYRFTVIQEPFSPKVSPSLSLPLRLRNWFGVLAVFLGLLVQTVHTHPFPVDHSATGKGHAVLTASVQTPDTCPLCVAMHSANPARSADTTFSFATVAVLLSRVQQRFVSKPPAYAHFSRPPPHSSL